MKMKYLFSWGIIIGLTLYAALSFAAEMQVQTGVQYNYWEDNKDNKASQSYVPIKIGVSYNNFRAGILAGFANTHVEKADGTGESLYDTLDTILNFSYEVLGKLPVDLLFGLDFNLPTGKTDFNQNELILIMDPDLAIITNFGEGYNINPTVSMVKEWGDIVAGGGIGYVWRGKYDFSESIRDYDPGDIANASAEIRYYFLPEWDARLMGYYAHYGKDKVGGEDFAQEGSHYLVGAGLNYDQIEWVTGITARAIFRDKTKLQETTGGLFTEENNSQGNEWIGDLYVIYNVNDRTTLKSTLQGLFIEKNNYPENSSRFIGRREKVSLEAGVARTFIRDLKGEFAVKGFVMHDEETNFPEVRDSTNYRGLVALVKVTKIF